MKSTALQSAQPGRRTPTVPQLRHCNWAHTPPNQKCSLLLPPHLLPTTAIRKTHSRAETPVWAEARGASSQICAKAVEPTRCCHHTLLLPPSSPRAGRGRGARAAPGPCSRGWGSRVAGGGGWPLGACKACAGICCRCTEPSGGPVPSRRRSRAGRCAGSPAQPCPVPPAAAATLGAGML